MKTNERAGKGIQRIFADAIALRNSGRLEEALQKLEEYRACSPDNSVAEDVIAGGILWTLGRFAEAEAAMSRVLAIEPLHAIASTVLVHCLLQTCQFDAGRAEASRYLRLVASGEAARAPSSTKRFFADVVDATELELRAMASAAQEVRSAAGVDAASRR